MQATCRLGRYVAISCDCGHCGGKRRLSIARAHAKAPHPWRTATAEAPALRPQSRDWHERRKFARDDHERRPAHRRAALERRRLRRRPRRRLESGGRRDEADDPQQQHSGQRAESADGAARSRALAPPRRPALGAERHRARARASRGPRGAHSRPRARAIGPAHTGRPLATLAIGVGAGFVIGGALSFRAGRIAARPRGRGTLLGSSEAGALRRRLASSSGSTPGEDDHDDQKNDAAIRTRRCPAARGPRAPAIDARACSLPAIGLLAAGAAIGAGIGLAFALLAGGACARTWAAAWTRSASGSEEGVPVAALQHDGQRFVAGAEPRAAAARLRRGCSAFDAFDRPRPATERRRGAERPLVFPLLSVARGLIAGRSESSSCRSRRAPGDPRGRSRAPLPWRGCPRCSRRVVESSLPR